MSTKKLTLLCAGIVVLTCSIYGFFLLKHYQKNLPAAREVFDTTDGADVVVAPSVTPATSSASQSTYPSFPTGVVRAFYTDYFQCVKILGSQCSYTTSQYIDKKQLGVLSSQDHDPIFCSQNIPKDRQHMKFSKSDVSGKTATTGVSIVFDQGTTNIQVSSQKEDGLWKITGIVCE